ncbi:MAG: GNAT family N-acetyltransferase [Clostridiales bacterium]|nr:GNAT family N-acetyltransferase [Clostridiales bacterium]
MIICRLTPQDPLWEKAADYAENCSWIAGKHLAQMMRENRFSDWETVFFAMEGERFAGYCTLLKEDYYPENRYSPWISSVFVEESFRGRQLSGTLIAAAEKYAKFLGFAQVYIPTDQPELYQRFGYEVIDSLVNYGGDTDQILTKLL